MNGYEKRTETKKKMIKKCAAELFNKYGFEKVTLEEIAAKASVSRVTIYKYFKDKENLQQEILKDRVFKTAADIEHMIKADLPFPVKFKKIILLKMDLTDLTPAQLVSSTVTQEGELGGIITPDLAKKIGCMLEIFIQQGVKEGFINPGLTPKTINNYFKLLRAGLKQLQDSNDALIYDREQLADMISLSMGGLKNGILDDYQ